jgi:hypothetical protein
MPETKLDLGDAAELGEILTFLAEWLSGSQKPVLEGSLADLHRFVLPLGVSDGEELFCGHAS